MFMKLVKKCFHIFIIKLDVRATKLLQHSTQQLHLFYVKQVTSYILKMLVVQLTSFGSIFPILKTTIPYLLSQF